MTLLSTAATTMRTISESVTRRARSFRRRDENGHDDGSVWATGDVRAVLDDLGVELDGDDSARLDLAEIWARTPPKLHLRVAARGRRRLIVDSAGRLPRTPGAIGRLLFHLEPGGLLVLAPGSRPPATAAEADALQGSLEARYPDSVGRIRAVRGHLVVENRRRLHACVREPQAAQLLRLRPDLGRVLSTRPSVTCRAKGRLSESRTDLTTVRPRAWVVPELAIREYDGVISAPGQVVRTDSLLLPETFRHWSRPKLHNKHLQSVVQPFFSDASRLPPFVQKPPPGGPRVLEGSFFHLDNEIRGHFGHMTTEVVAKLWGWREAKRADPGLRALLHANGPRTTLASWELDLLAAGGVAAEDIVVTPDPVRVEHLLTATQMFEDPYYVHPDLAGIWGEMGDRLVAEGSTATPDRIFVSRRLTKRACRNGAEVEALFAELGFTVIFPEDYPLPEQVRIFRQASAVAGFMGSGMFTLMFVSDPKPVLLVGSDTYTPRNEFLIAGALGHDLSVAWCEAERDAPPDGKRFQAGFVFDMDTEGEFIRAAAAGL
ncbi:MAG: glycosyltransferase 61 family protein [Nocardioides sp.]|uniref:glycosyltransferase family 61 protein n=1 Tax=Nocardioides sp. TaxID=35761 RepID=UPI0039E634D1